MLHLCRLCAPAFSTPPLTHAGHTCCLRSPTQHSLLQPTNSTTNHPQKQGRQPDFKLKSKSHTGALNTGAKDALWLQDRMMPAWARNNLQMLPGARPFPTPNFIPPQALTSTNPKEQQWVQVFVNYSSFWDNRMNVSHVFVLCGWALALLVQYVYC